MLDQKIVAGLIERLSALNWWPHGNVAARNDILDALNSARNEIIATAVVNEWIKSSPDAPKPADIYRLISELSPAVRPLPVERPEVTGSETDAEMDRKWEQMKQWMGEGR